MILFCRSLLRIRYWNSIPPGDGLFKMTLFPDKSYGMKSGAKLSDLQRPKL